MAPDLDEKEDSAEMVIFRKEMARLRKDFDVEMKEILDRIRARRLKAIKEKIQS